MAEHLNFHAVSWYARPPSALSGPAQNEVPEWLSPGRTTGWGRCVPGGMTPTLLVSARFIMFIPVALLLAVSRAGTMPRSLPNTSGGAGNADPDGSATRTVSSLDCLSYCRPSRAFCVLSGPMPSDTRPTEPLVEWAESRETSRTQPTGNGPCYRARETCWFFMLDFAAIQS